jgi:hypothetical protein
MATLLRSLSESSSLCVVGTGLSKLPDERMESITYKEGAIHVHGVLLGVLILSSHPLKFGKGGEYADLRQRVMTTNPGCSRGFFVITKKLDLRRKRREATRRCRLSTGR